MAAKTQSAKSHTSQRTKHAVDAIFETDDLAKEQVAGFVTFLREHAIVGLAVGFIAGAQAQAVVKQLVASFVDPTLILLFGGVALSKRTVSVSLFHNKADFAWGAMVYAIINLIFVLASVYALIKIFKLDKLDKPKEAPAVAAEKPKKGTPRKK